MVLPLRPFCHCWICQFRVVPKSLRRSEFAGSSNDMIPSWGLFVSDLLLILNTRKNLNLLHYEPPFLQFFQFVVFFLWSTTQFHVDHVSTRRRVLLETCFELNSRVFVSFAAIDQDFVIYFYRRHFRTVFLAMSACQTQPDAEPANS